MGAQNNRSINTEKTIMSIAKVPLVFVGGKFHAPAVFFRYYLSVQFLTFCCSHFMTATIQQVSPIVSYTMGVKFHRAANSSDGVLMVTGVRMVFGPKERMDITAPLV